MTGDLSAHFSAHEFDCPCCGLLNVAPELLDALEQYRIDVGSRPVTVLSACRCPQRNAAVRGEAHSQHLTTGLRACTAADIHVPGLTLAGMYFAACKVTAFAGGGIGIYLDKVFIHVDVRPDRARWGHMSGRYVPFVAAWNVLKNEEGIA